MEQTTYPLVQDFFHPQYHCVYVPTGDAVKFVSFVFDPVNLDVPWPMDSTCAVLQLSRWGNVVFVAIRLSNQCG